MTDTFWQTAAMATALAFVLGSCVGSFINVVAHRLPKMLAEDGQDNSYNLAWPPSHCPHCQQPIKAKHNLPIIGYLRLAGRTPCCGQPIGFHYLLVEIFTGVLSVLVYLHLVVGSADPLNLLSPPLTQAMTTEIFVSLALLWWLIALSVMIWRQSSATFSLWQSLTWLGLLVNISGRFSSLSDAVTMVCLIYLFGFAVLNAASFTTSNDAYLSSLTRSLHATAAALAWFASALFWPIAFAAIVIVMVMTIRSDQPSQLVTSSKSSRRLAVENQYAQTVFVAIMVIGWVLGVSR